VAWTPVVRGVADIEGIPTSLCRLFSTRRRQIEAHLATHATGVGRADGRGAGRLGQLAARAACLITRPGKQHTPPASRRERWWAQARAVGFTTTRLTDVLHRESSPGTPDPEARIDRVLSAQGVTRQQASFDQGAVLRELCQQLPAGVDLSSPALLRLSARIVHRPDVVPVVGPDGGAYTTLDMLSVEQHALALAARREQDRAAQLPVAEVVPLVVPSGLRPDQQRAVQQLLTCGRGVDVISGPAGSGKTAALRIAAEIWQARGIPVAGTAVAALTAQGLQDASGAPSVSLARLLHQPERHLPTRGVLLVDEAGMVGTRTLSQLLELTQQRGCKLVLIGDPAQLPELEAGGLFAALAQCPATLRLEGHHRQQASWERVALAALRCGETSRAIDSYDQHGRLHIEANHDELCERLAEDYVRARASQDDPWEVLAIASRRCDVRLLNDRIRIRLHEQGVLGERSLTVETDDGAREFRTGDQVLVSRNDHRRQLLNGTAATITALGDDGLRLRTRQGAEVDVDRRWLQAGQLDHGYAMTVHKAQGRTVHTALLLADSGLGAEAGYVGLSRGTHANHCYLAVGDDPRGDDVCLSAQRASTTTRRDRNALDHVMRHRQQQHMATDRLAEGRQR
jgi:hypothetical protein